MNNFYRKIAASLFVIVAAAISVSSESSPLPRVQNTAGHDLMPAPAAIEFRQDVRFPITGNFGITFAGFRDGRLERAAERTIIRLQRTTVLGLRNMRVVGSGSDSAATSNDGLLVIDCGSAGANPPRLGEDESYSLNVDGRKAVLKAPTSTGVLRGLETFLQLVKGDGSGFYVPGVSIQDAPRFEWRGLLIDCARHFQPVPVLKRNLDAMAAVKMNVLHWHLTEDQGFRVESKVFPRLQEMGSDGNFYTQEEIREIIAYAADRGIRVVPEFDMPGHATAWLVGHPELGSAPGPYTIERDPGIFDPTLDPTKESTYKFLAKFLAEMAKLFPDQYMHIGGDENEGKQWDANPDIQAFMKQNGIKDNHGLQTYFNKRILKMLKKDGKIMMGWDEIFQPDLPKDVVIHSWRGQKALAEAARKGYTGVLSNGYYIDLIFPASQHYLVDPIPADSTLTDEEKKRILGGEATMWSEWVSPETIDSRIWPRTAAIAERFWSPQDVRDVNDMYRRLAATSRRLENLGLTHKKNQSMMLRRLAGTDDIWNLKALVDLVEPVKGYKRYQLRPQTMLDPLTGFIDAAVPDAPGRRRFAKLVSSFLSDPNSEFGTLQLVAELQRWRFVASDVNSLIAGSPALREIRDLPPSLTALADIGMRSADHYSGDHRPADGWKAATLKRIDELTKPKGGVEFVFVDDLKRLVEAAAPSGTEEPQ